MEITHIEGENKELKASLRNFETQEEEFKNVTKSQTKLYVSLRELWNLFKILETNDMISKITKITAEYYRKAYQDGDEEPGLNEDQYDSLVRSSVVPVSDKPFFPPFDWNGWQKDNDGNILVDEFERVLVLIYKNILNEELKVELRRVENTGDRSLGFTRAILQTQPEEQKDNNDAGGIFSRFFGGD